MRTRLPTRRSLPLRVAAGAAALAVVVSLAPQAPASAAVRAAAPGTNHAVDDPFTSSRTAWWREARFGMFIHFGDYSYWGGEYTRPDGTVCQDAEWIKNRCSIPWPEYEAAARRFNPARFDANAIVQLAKDAGQRYIVITAKHHDGYAMWPTRTNPWNLRDHSSFDRSRDILAELKQAAEAQGIRFGLYYSINDWHHPGTANNHAEYKQNMYAQLRELMTNYRPAVLWFDGHSPDWWTLAEAEQLQVMLRGLNPNIIINDRVGKSRGTVDGDHETPERHQNIPTANLDAAVWESCVTSTDRWGWARYDTNIKSSSMLTRFLLDIVGRDGNYLLNIGPDSNGVVTPLQANALRGIGRWLGTAQQSLAVYGATYTGLVADPAWGAVSRRSDKVYLSVYDWPAAGTPLHLTTRDSFGITAARVLGSTQAVTWRAAGDGFDITPSGARTNDIATVIELTITTPSQVTGNGAGLAAQYWTNSSFSGTPAVTRTDRSLNYAWRTGGSPAPTIPVDNFSARWTGFVQAQFTGNHTFLTVSDDTVKVWVDGTVVIDNSTPHGPTVNKGTIRLQAGQRYAIRVDYTERTGEAYLKLLWSNPNRKQRIIPTSQLYPA
ncbi:MAG TPA: alpha-L-fucosidase [Pilimelia sp.]|nr:alpha-L-fucosidase [Pilimelia sp.]